jgi:ankyrin repeat protein
MTPNDDTRDEELLARYRQASADAPGPSDAVRAAILAESRRVAAELAKQAPRKSIDISRPAANDSRWRLAVFGTAGAALLAALLFAPRFWEIAPPAQVRAPPPAPSAAAQDQAKAEAPQLAQLKPPAAQSYTAPARQSLSDSTSLQEVVTHAERKVSKSAGAPSSHGAPSSQAAPSTHGAPSSQLAAAAQPPAPAARNSIGQNYAPVSPSAAPLAAAPPARANLLDSSAFVGGVPSKRANAAGADSSLQPATLQSAVAQGDVAQTALLLDRGAVIDARDEAGRTPLMLAVTQGKLEIVRLLLARGADPNAADSAGHTPLQQATKHNLQDVAALLEQAGAH